MGRAVFKVKLMKKFFIYKDYIAARIVYHQRQSDGQEGYIVW